MGFCIYHKKADPDLRFDKEEHVIPAGLGGIKKLEKGTVSDEANERFSKEELVVLRDTFIGLNRMNNGPGKRGSLNVKKIKQPIMRVLRQKKEQGPLEFLLGFIFAGASYPIPQVVLEFSDFNDETDILSPMYISPNIDEPSADNFRLELNKELIQFFRNDERQYKPVRVPFKTNKHLVHIGHYQGKWYIATSLNKPINMDNLGQTLVLLMVNQMIQESKNEKKLIKPQIINKPLLEYKDQLNTDGTKFYFLYLKTAFNALALFKGIEFVCNEIFDEIRESIINVKDTDKFICSREELNDPEVKTTIKTFPDKAHFVIIRAKNNKLNAYVSFYEKIPVMIELTSKYEGENFIDGLICDWQNRKELRLRDL
ncbi:hypothetical protein ACW5UC_23890 [Priestia aryabhattai]|uniref:hypothetical protein n=1 Tax=Priestia megaterium TaxID=1404 RepID=UPI003F95FD44